MDASNQALQRAFASHDRAWHEFAYVYAVISRRSRGLSIGVNLNVDQACNFDCVYCSVNRRLTDRAEARPREVSLGRLREELRALIAAVADGSVWREPQFCDVEKSYRRLNDIAFSGDGEPTSYARFDEACRLVADVKAEFGLCNAKIVLITNATLLDRSRTLTGLAILDANQGEVWAKLDAGTQAYYDAVDRPRRTAIPLAKILANIGAAGRVRPIVIQTMLLRLREEAMPDAEFDAYVARLRELIAVGCRIDRVQLYTIVRPTAEAHATPLPTPQLEARATQLRLALRDVGVETYPGIEP